MNTAQPSNEAPAGRSLQVLDSLHRHARLVVVLIPLIVLAGLPVVFIQGQPSYQSTATFQVSPRYMKTLRDDIELEFQSNTQFLQFIQQQARTVNRYDIVERALITLDEQEQALWLPDQPLRRRVERLQQSLAIRHVRDTYLVQVTLTADQPEGLADIVNAVVDAYLVQARAEQVFASDDRVGSLHQREQALLEEISDKTGERSLISERLGLTAFNPDDTNPFDRQLRQLQEDLIEARQQRIRAQARLEAFQTQQESDTALRSIQESLLSDPGLNSLKASLNQRRAQLLSETAGLADNHPGRLDALDELATIDQEIAQREAALREQLLSGMLRRHQASSQQAVTVEHQLEQALAELQARSGRYAEHFNNAVALTRHLDLLWSELDRVRDRLNFFAAEEASPGFSRLVTAAKLPLYPTGTGKKRLLILLLLAAGGLSLAVPVVIDFLDPRIRTVADAHRALGFAPIGWLVEADRPERQRFLKDQLRRLASSLVREHSRHGTRIIALSSARPTGGTSWLTRQLADTLQGLGYPCLIVEANAYRPLDGSRQGPGLAQWLSDDHTAPPIHRRDGQDFLPSGLDAGHAGLPMLERLAERLRSLPADYRFVLVDAPPLLTHADAELVAMAADGVLLLAEAESLSRGELQRAGRLLKAIDPPVVGSIVNRVRPFLGGGYIGGLVEEHERGSKIDERGRLAALISTLRALIEAPRGLLADLAGVLKPRRSR
ncbi:MAG: GumC family protein [Wenzhouxiangella sp.]